MENVCRIFFERSISVFVHPLQAELDNVNMVLSEVEGKSIKATKDCSAVESQLQDVQVIGKKQSHGFKERLMKFLCFLKLCFIL